MTKQDTFSGSSKDTTKPKSGAKASRAAKKENPFIPDVLTSKPNFQTLLRNIASECNKTTAAQYRKNIRGAIRAVQRAARQNPDFLEVGTFNTLLHLLKAEHVRNEFTWKTNMANYGFRLGQDEEPYSIASTLLDVISDLLTILGEHRTLFPRAESDDLRSQLGHIMSNYAALYGSYGALNGKTRDLAERWRDIGVAAVSPIELLAHEVSIPTSGGSLGSPKERGCSRRGSLCTTNRDLAYGSFGNGSRFDGVRL